jgi:hypothetical protein
MVQAYALDMQVIASWPHPSAGQFKVIEAILSAPGGYPQGVIKGTGGNLYGLASFDGASTNCDQGCGTSFKMTLH